jgi:hypothetical protein
MNCPTTRCTTPAAATRTGRGESALPRPDPGAKTRSQLPFAALPHDLRKDPRLKGHRTAVVLAAALLEYARDSSHCWPSNRRLAEDLGVCQQTVRNALAALRTAGWVRIEQGAWNPTGRVIWLCWRAELATPTPSNRLDPPHKPVGGDPLKPVGPEVRSVIVESGGEPDAGAGARSRPDPLVAPLSQPVVVTTTFSAEAIPPAPPDPAPRPEPPPAEPRQAHVAAPVPDPLTAGQNSGLRYPPPPPALSGPEAARPAFRRAPAEPPAHPRSEPAPGREKALPLTPEEQARLDAMDPGVRDQILTWLMLGDPILMREVRAKLAPPRPKPKAPQSLPELLANIRTDPSYPAAAAQALSQTLGDAKSYSGYLRRCEEAWRGELEPRRLVAAYEQATGPKARNGGAIFMHALKCTHEQGP